MLSAEKWRRVRQIFEDALDQPPEARRAFITDACRDEPELLPELKAMRILSGLGYGVLRPLIRGSTATGSLLRRKLESVIVPIVGQIAVLRGPHE